MNNMCIIGNRQAVPADGVACTKNFNLLLFTTILDNKKSTNLRAAVHKISNGFQREFKFLLPTCSKYRGSSFSPIP